MLTKAAEVEIVPMLQPASVLVVDDEPFNIDLLSQELEQLGHVPVPAMNGAEALERVAEGGHDLMLLDIMMPGVSGIQVLERLRSEQALPELPVIVVSALDDLGSVVRCIELGAEDHLVKPFDPVLLRARIANSLEKKRLRDQIARQLSATRALFGRYVPRAIAEDILSGDGALAPIQSTATVLYADIVGFTGIAQGMPPDQALAFLNEFFQTIIEPIRDAGGVVNEFIGDGILVTFNLPRANPRHADQAVCAALGIQDVLNARKIQGHQVRARIGIHTGPVIAGNVSAGDRLHYTVLGDTVNVSARLEEANKRYGTAILISGSTVTMLQDDYELERLDDATIRGKDEPVTIFRQRPAPVSA